MNNIETLKAIYQSVANRFVVDRDDAISSIQQMISSENPDPNRLAEAFRALTMAKLNIMGVQEETSNTINQYNAQAQDMAQAEIDAKAELEAKSKLQPDPSPNGIENSEVYRSTEAPVNPVNPVGEGGYGVTNSPFPDAPSQ